jgi:hypothetical protein
MTTPRVNFFYEMTKEELKKNEKLIKEYNKEKDFSKEPQDKLKGEDLQKRNGIKT